MKIKLLLALLLFGLTLGGLPVMAESGGGPLEPPGAPGPSMRTLDEIGQAADAAVEASEAAAEAADPRTPIAAADLPYEINQPGSYYFTEDIEFTFSPESDNAITIKASNVTLDLMGFALRSDSSIDSGDGIRIDQGLENITIRNGHIAGNRVITVDESGWSVGGTFGFGYGVRFVGNSSVAAQAVILERLHVSGGAFGGILLRGNAVIESCVAFSNGGHGIDASGSGSTVNNSIARRNTGSGIIASDGTVSDSIARENQGIGISATSGSVSHSVARENGGIGILTTSGSVSHSVARTNGGHGISATWGSVTHSTARWNGGHGIRIESQGVVAFCMASENGQDSGTDISASQATRTGNFPSP